MTVREVPHRHDKPAQRVARPIGVTRRGHEAIGRKTGVIDECGQDA